MVNLCTTTFNRQDLLRQMLLSLKESTVMPDNVYIIDHGYDKQKIQDAVKDTIPAKMHRIVLQDPGCAHAGNWCLINVSEDRIMAADDALFHPDTIEVLLATPGDLVVPSKDGSFGGFTLGLHRDTLIEKVGLWDETISPGYLYYEDWDYTRRMALAGVGFTSAECGFTHNGGGSNTTKMYTPAQQREHHRRFLLAKQNYFKKWGDYGEPAADPKRAKFVSVPEGVTK